MLFYAHDGWVYFFVRHLQVGHLPHVKHALPQNGALTTVNLLFSASCFGSSWNSILMDPGSFLSFSLKKCIVEFLAALCYSGKGNRMGEGFGSKTGS